MDHFDVFIMRRKDNGNGIIGCNRVSGIQANNIGGARIPAL
jgi:hypothetical protein